MNAQRRARLQLQQAYDQNLANARDWIERNPKYTQIILKVIAETEKEPNTNPLQKASALFAIIGYQAAALTIKEKS